MFKSFQDTSALQQFHGFPNLNMQQATSAYGFSGVTFWLDAAYGLNTQTNLGAVSRWQARVGSALFTQSTAALQPRLILNDINFNNLPSVESQDSVRYMDTALGTGFRMNVPNITFVAVSKVNVATQRSSIMAISGAGTGIFDGGTRLGYNGFGWYGNDGAQIIGTTETLNQRIKIITGTNIIINGAIETTGNSGSFQSELNRIFTLDGASANNYYGSIAEIIAFGYSMTSDEAIALSNNINQKYALY